MKGAPAGAVSGGSDTLLEKGPWCAWFKFAAYGVVVEVRTTDRSFLDELRGTLPCGSVLVQAGTPDFVYSVRIASGGASRRITLWRASEVLLESTSVRKLLERLESSLALTIAEFSKTEVFVHAGAVSWRDRVIVIPGRTFSGKSTLVAALVRAGAGYLSDEFALIDAEGRVRPYPRPVALRRKRDGKQFPIGFELLGGFIERRVLPVGLVLDTRFREGAVFRPRRLTSGETLLALLSQTVPARIRPEASLSRFRLAVDGAVGLRGVRGEAIDAVGWLLQPRLWDVQVP